MNKKGLRERDICTKFITPAIQAAGWESHLYREEVKLTKGRVIVHGQPAIRIQNLRKLSCQRFFTDFVEYMKRRGLMEHV